jgi:hypothetical protein
MTGPGFGASLSGVSKAVLNGLDPMGTLMAPAQSMPMAADPVAMALSQAPTMGDHMVQYRCDQQPTGYRPDQRTSSQPGMFGLAGRLQNPDAARGAY